MGPDYVNTNSLSGFSAFFMKNCRNTNLRPRIVSNKIDYKKLLSIAPDYRLTRNIVPSSRLLTGFQTYTLKNSCPGHISTVMLIVYSPKDSEPVLGTSVFLFPNSLKSKIELLEVTDDMLVPRSFSDINPTDEDTLMLGYTATKPGVTQYSLPFFNIYKRFLQSLLIYYNLKCTVLQFSKGVCSGGTESLSFPLNLANLDENTARCIGVEAESAMSSSKFSILIGMKKDGSFVSRRDLGPIFYERADLLSL